MKQRHIEHKDDWKTPDYFYKSLYKEFNFDFDPCPFMHDINAWDGRFVSGGVNFCNPPYSLKLKTDFVLKGLNEYRKGKTVVFLLPVSTSTRLFHDVIQPNATEIRFVQGRIPFIGINTKGQYVNWHLCNENPPPGAQQIKNSGMHNSMIVVFKATQS